MNFRVGSGFDRHRLIPGDELRLGGVPVAADVTAEAHSDGDVLLHALVDALLGATGRGDIGDEFPPSDPKWKDADSKTFVERTLSELRPGWRICNVDCTIFLERPKLAEYKELIGLSVARLLDLQAGLVNVKAKTGEGVGPVGTGEAVEAHVAVLLERAVSVE